MNNMNSQLASEKAQVLAFAGLLLEEVTDMQLSRCLERYELLCEQRGWPFPEKEATSW